MTKLSPSFLILTLGLAACETTSSADLKTSGIDAEILASASSGDSTTVTAYLYPGGDDDPFNRVELNNGDALYAEVNGMRSKMSERGSGTYETSFATAAADTLFTVSLERALEEDKDAPNSTATLPAPFDIGALTKTTFSRAEDLVVTWSPSGSGDNMDIEVDGDCISSPTGNFTVSGDPGTFTIAANELESFDSQNPESCAATITVRRMRAGSADAALNQESSFNAQQIRNIGYTSDP